MKRPLVVALAVLAALALAVSFLVRRGPHGGAGVTNQDGRSFVSDSLGVALRLPDSPGWTLRPESPTPGGAVVAAVHEGQHATVRLFATPTDPKVDLETVLRQRQAQVAAVLGVQDLQQVIAKVLRSDTKMIDGFPALQWQAITEPIGAPGEPPSNVVFMWLLTKRPARAFECVGLVRTPVKSTPEDQAKSEALLQDVAYILQSFQVR